MWPYANSDHSEIYVTVGLGRPFRKPICNLLISKDYGESWSTIADFHSMDKRNTTTGQPFVTKERVVFVPVWSASFYTHGVTWFAIYRSKDGGFSWEKVYEDPKGTYGNHFFQNPANAKIYIGVGVGGGGSKGRIDYAPAKSYLLESADHGKTWKKVLKVNYPTALYSGTASDDNTILVTAREKKSILRSMNGGESWSEVGIYNATRSILYIKKWEKTIVTSNSSIFVSDDEGSTWIRVNCPIKGLILRYPTLHKGKVCMTGVGLGSYVISTDLNNWYITFDVTGEAGGNIFTRMAIVDDFVYLGDELNGALICAKLPAEDNEPINRLQVVEFGLKYLILMARYGIRRILGRARA